MTDQDKGGSRDFWVLPYRAHPWHGVPIGPEAPKIVTVYIEIVPSDYVKFEIDKLTGYLRVDRPQKYSNICPSLYGFIPQTYSAERVAERFMEKTRRSGIVGDGDPLDICVLAERPMARGDLLLEAIPIGGLRLLDGEQADDKIIAVMQNDPVFGEVRDLRAVPTSVVERLTHYFLTYKDAPRSGELEVELTDVYGRVEAHEVIRCGQADYRTHFRGEEA